METITRIQLHWSLLWETTPNAQKYWSFIMFMAGLCEGKINFGEPVGGLP